MDDLEGTKPWRHLLWPRSLCLSRELEQRAELGLQSQLALYTACGHCRWLLQLLPRHPALL